MKRKERADGAHAALNDPAFLTRLGAAVEARGNVETTGHDVRELALKMLPRGTLDRVKASFRWDPEERKVEVLVKGATVSVDEQAEVDG